MAVTIIPSRWLVWVIKVSVIVVRGGTESGLYSLDLPGAVQEQQHDGKGRSWRKDSRNATEITACVRLRRQLHDRLQFNRVSST